MATVDVGDEVPDFRLDSQVGLISFHDFVDAKWCVLITIGKINDPVSTTEIGMLQKLEEEFEDRHLSIVIVGNDSVANYRKWIKDIDELQSTRVTMPILSDPDCKVLSQWGCARIAPDGHANVVANGIFLIDIDKRIRSSFRYSPSTGRNLYEILRVFDALQLVTHHRVVCPVNWASGQEVIIHPEVRADEAAQFRFAEIKPWFRLTSPPE